MITSTTIRPEKALFKGVAVSAKPACQEKIRINYTPFGAPLQNRTWQLDTTGYRFGFNGKETDKETDLQDYGMRIYNRCLGKFLSVDPLTNKYSFYSPFQFAGNSPIMFVDLDGAEPYGPPFPTDGTPHIRYYYTPIYVTPIWKKVNGTYQFVPSAYYLQVKYVNVRASQLNRVLEDDNKLNEGKGRLITGRQAELVSTQQARLWRPIDGPIVNSIPLTTRDHYSYGGIKITGDPAVASARVITVPNGDAVTSATFSYSGGGTYANSFSLINDNTGEVIAMVPATADNGTITVDLTKLSPGMNIRIVQQPSATTPSSVTADSWNYTLKLTVSTTEIKTVYPSSEPVSSPGEPVYPVKPVEKPAEVRDVNHTQQNTLNQ